MMDVMADAISRFLEPSHVRTYFVFFFPPSLLSTRFHIFFTSVERYDRLSLFFFFLVINVNISDETASSEITAHKKNAFLFGILQSRLGRVSMTNNHLAKNETKQNKKFERKKFLPAQTVSWMGVHSLSVT